VDLACGTGYLGIAAAALGADVTLTDGLPEVLHIARANAALNRAAVARSGGALAVAGCAWGEPVAHLLPAGGPPFDVVLASEAVYSQEQFAPFAATLRALAGPRTRVLLGVRQRACCSLEDLLALLREHFDATELPLEAAALLQAEALSKTHYKPQLFLLAPRAVASQE
jgi:predicted nicotinamide N-methyase